MSTQYFLVPCIGLTLPDHNIHNGHLRKTNLSCNKLSIFIQILQCSLSKYLYLPPRRDSSLDPPPPPTHLSGNSNHVSYINLRFRAFESPPPLRNFQSLLLGEYGYFLELHNNLFSFFQMVILCYVMLCYLILCYEMK